MPTQPDGQSCATCRYHRTYAERDGGDTSREYTGFCRRFPPNVPNSEHDAQYPELNGDEWCGEYAPANPETVTDGAATLARLVLLGDLTAARALADKLRE